MFTLNTERNLQRNIFYDNKLFFMKINYFFIDKKCLFYQFKEKNKFSKKNKFY